MDILSSSGITLREIGYALALSALLVGIITFLLAFNSIWITGWKKRRKVSQRLAEVSKQHLMQIKLLKEKLEGRSDRIVALFGTWVQKKIANLQSQLLKADIFYDPLAFLGVAFSLGVIGFFLGIIGLKHWFYGLSVACGLGALPYLYLKRLKKLKSVKFEAQFPGAMDLLGLSLRAGHTMSSAIELLSSEVEPPLSTEMLIAFEEQRFGLSIAESLIHMVGRVDSQDLKYFVTAVLIQQETGGNLVEIIEKISHVIRARLNFKIKISALTADGRLSATILTILPAVMFVLLLILRPEYEGALIHDPLGRKLLAVAIIILLLGLRIMNKLVKSIEV